MIANVDYENNWMIDLKPQERRDAESVTTTKDIFFNRRTGARTTKVTRAYMWIHFNLDNKIKYRPN